MKKTVRRIMLLITLLVFVASAASASAYSPLILTADEAAAANLFLSNFTETGLDRISDWGDDTERVDFAHDHLWFNDYDAYEFGEYFGENNCRVSDERIQEIADKYFYDSYPLDLAQTRFDYADGYYYHCETGGWTDCGFAHVISLCPVGDDAYYVSFLIFGGGYDWDNDVMNKTLEEIEAAYGHPCGYGSALIHAEDLSDRSAYRLISYSRL